ncbi:MAG: multicomponent Na+:H+ antiporter subunit [Frankiaceae bacterium]|jgi:multicomponent Na+:H+ antiporter subunit F|nr:multicomponent Na+:H+ antiporter subunit [Frankiaceae bacterium]
MRWRRESGGVVNAALVAALVLTGIGLPLCLARTAVGGVLSRLVGLQLGGTVVALVLLLVANGTGRSAYYDLALVLSLLSFAGSLVFLRFLQRLP